MAADEHGKRSWHPPRERCREPVDVLPGPGHDCADKGAVLALALSSIDGLLECVALDGLGRELVDVGKDGLGEQCLRGAVHAGGSGGSREAPPGHSGADAVGELERVEGAAGSELAATERQVDLAARSLGRDRVPHLI